jgi:DNA-binding beta-propeller fold protein YncE
MCLTCLAWPGAALAQVVSYAFVPNWAGPTKAVVIDTTTHTIVPSTIVTSSSPTTAAASPDGRVVYLLSDRLHVVDVPQTNITIVGTGASRTLQLTASPNANGTALIGFHAGAGLWSHSRSIALTVNPVNDPPTITPLARNR